MFVKNYQKKENMLGKVCFKNNCFEVELGKTPEQKAKGLMFRQNLAENKGMLFIYEKEGIYSFFMKNVQIPLDIIWINKDNKIVFIKENFLPCEQEPCEKISSPEKAKYVLEINAGISQKMDFEIGDKMDIEY